MAWKHNGNAIKQNDIADIVYDVYADDTFEGFLNDTQESVTIMGVPYSVGTTLRRLDESFFAQLKDYQCESIVRDIIANPERGAGFGIEWVDEDEDDEDEEGSDEDPSKSAFVCVFTPEAGAMFMDIPIEYNGFRKVMATINPGMDCFGCTPRKVGNIWVDVWYDDTCRDEYGSFCAMTNGKFEITGGIVLALNDAEGNIASIDDNIRKAIEDSIALSYDITTGNATFLLMLGY